MLRAAALAFLVYGVIGLRPPVLFGLCDGLRTAYLPAMNSISLPGELEQYAAQAVAAGGYRDMSELVQAGLTPLKQAEVELTELVASLEEARAEGGREGFPSGAQVEPRVRAAIAKVVARRG